MTSIEFEIVNARIESARIGGIQIPEMGETTVLVRAILTDAAQKLGELADSLDGGPRD